jgi:transcriptional regulator with XRE-family HTH domain
MLSPEQCRAARAWLGWGQDDLAKMAKVSLSTIRDFESGKRWEPIEQNADALQRTLEDAGILFLSSAHNLSGISYDPRITERSTYEPILKLLAKQPDGFMKTSDLIKNLEIWFAPDGEDAEILKGRSDTRFSQIVRNVVSHRTTPTNLIGLGLAEYDKVRRGLRITEEGRLSIGAAEADQKILL